MARLSDEDFAIQKRINPVLTAMAWAVRKKLREQMEQSFDRPKSWTLNGLQVIPASTDNDNLAELQIKTGNYGGTPHINVLSHHFTGGSRANSGLEKALQREGILPAGWYAVPTMFCPVDANGNVKPGHVNKIMSYLELYWKSGHDSNSTRQTKDKTRKKEGGGWFVVQHSGAGKTKSLGLKAGIYFRNYKTNQAIPEFRFYRSFSPYQKRFDMHDTFDEIKGPWLEKLTDVAAEAMNEQLMRIIKSGLAAASDKGKLKVFLRK